MIFQEIVTRKEAVASNIAFYYTGKPCKYGHYAKKRVSNNACTLCEREKNKGKSDYKHQHYIENKKKYIDRAKEQYKNNSDIIKKRASLYSKNNICKIIKQRNERMKIDNVYACREKVRNCIKESIRKKGYTKKSITSKIVGCTFEELKTHIEKQFIKGMSWDNRHLWHIDHVIPISSAKTENDVIMLNHFTNLRPLWAKDNLSKGGKREFLI
jgi:hypothetical protein